MKNLVKEYKFDSVRVDTTRHVRMDFWPSFAEAAGVFSIGEIANGDVRVVAKYTGR